MLLGSSADSERSLWKIIYLSSNSTLKTFCPSTNTVWFLNSLANTTTTTRWRTSGTAHSTSAQVLSPENRIIDLIKTEWSGNSSCIKINIGSAHTVRHTIIWISLIRGSCIESTIWRGRRELIRDLLNTRILTVFCWNIKSFTLPGELIKLGSLTIFGWDGTLHQQWSTISLHTHTWKTTATKSILNHPLVAPLSSTITARSPTSTKKATSTQYPTRCTANSKIKRTQGRYAAITGIRPICWWQQGLSWICSPSSWNENMFSPSCSSQTCYSVSVSCSR